MTYSRQFISFRRLLTAAFCVSAFASSASGQASDNAGPPADARPMTGYELYMLYRDNSWKWPDGAGRMEIAGRRFTAFAGPVGERNLAEGTWIVTDSGRLCFDADWNAPSGIYSDRTCFAHLIGQDTIYQRKEPAGDWYVFKHAETEPGDEFNKLVPQDLVSAELEGTRPGTDRNNSSPPQQP